MYSPIAMFIYNRPDYLRHTLDALGQCKNVDKHDLFVFSDSPSYTRTEDAALVDETRQLIKQVKDEQVFNSVTLIVASEHKGCRLNVKEGIDYVLDRYDRLIDVEDDIIVSQDFLDYMDDALETYKNDKRVFSVAGYTHDLPSIRDVDNDVFLLRRFCSWGFGIWRDRWDKVDFNTAENYKNESLMIKLAQYGYDLPEMLMYEEMDCLDTWDVQVCLAECLNDMCTLYPRFPKALTIGSNGTHYSSFDSDKTQYKIPDAVEYDLSECEINTTLCEEMRSISVSENDFWSWWNSKHYFYLVYKNYFYSRLLGLKHKGVDVSCFFKAKGFMCIVIYGATDVARCLQTELKDSGVRILGFVDRNPALAGVEIDGVYVYDSISEIETDMDCVVITPMNYLVDIKKKLINQGVNPYQMITITEIVR